MANLTIDRRSKTPLDLQIARLIRSAIFNDDFKGGSFLPSREELMKQYDVEETIIDKVLERLLRHKLVENVNQEQYRITSFRSATLMNKKVVTTKDRIEALGLKFSTKDLFMKVMNTSPNLVKVGFDRDEKVLYFRRVYFGDNIPITAMDIYLPLKKFPDVENILPKYSTFYTMIREYYQIQIGKSRHILSASLLPKDIADILNYPQDSAGLHSTSTSYSKDGELLEYSIIYTGGELIRLEYNMPRSQLR